jgi:3-methyladenine DNA glycosylase AlkD
VFFVLTFFPEVGMASVDEVLKNLQEKASAENVAGMARFGMSSQGRLGVSVPDLRKLAKETGKDHALALALWQTGIEEARIVAAMVDDPGQLSEQQMEQWVLDIHSWDVCDQVCMNLFEKSPLAWKKIRDWSVREEEFVKRTAFSLTACMAWHDKRAEDRRFLDVLPLIEQASSDERNFVKKAVNWALRNIGKRNAVLHRAALDCAHRIQRLDSKAARWIASDAIRELESESLQKRLGL